MKTSSYIIIYLSLFLSLSGVAQSTSDQKILITGTRFTYPLVEKWISEFKKTNPDVEIKILARGSAGEEQANVTINAHKLTTEEVKENYEYFNIGRYVLLPVSNANNPLNDEWLKKGLKEGDVKDIFFEKEHYLDEGAKKRNKNKDQITPTVYTREQQACAPKAFANHYGFKQENLNGKGVSGDDKFLIYAVKKDSSGITYNNPGYVYDIATREVLQGIKVIPYDLNENGKVDPNENFYQNLDDLIQNAENSKSPSLPIENIHISFNKELVNQNKNLKLFLDYIINAGQKFNHDFGLLNPDVEYIAKQKAFLNNSSK